MKRYIKDKLKTLFFYIYKICTRYKFHILPIHFYSPLPDILELEKTKSIWAKKSELPGLQVNLDEQVINLITICQPYHEEYVKNIFYQAAATEQLSGGFGYIEQQGLYSVIRYYKPKRIIEVGSGTSTFSMLAAAKINANETKETCLITCIDPYPSTTIKNDSNISLIHQKIQYMPITMFQELNANDILFIDSSHTVKPGSDVNFLILEVLPRLSKGVIIHFHDIYLPYDYQRRVLSTFYYWAETSLLRAFLIFNNKFKIIFCMSHLHYDCKEALAIVFPEYNPQKDIDGLLIDEQVDLKHFPSSIYLQVQ
jgi:hypothetical protein